MDYRDKIHQREQALFISSEIYPQGLYQKVLESLKRHRHNTVVQISSSNGSLTLFNGILFNGVRKAVLERASKDLECLETGVM